MQINRQAYHESGHWFRDGVWTKWFHFRKSHDQSQNHDPKESINKQKEVASNAKCEAFAKKFKTPRQIVMEEFKNPMIKM